MLVLVEGIGKLRLETRPGECGECSSFVTLFFAKKSLTKTDRCAGALSWRRNQTLVLCFPRLFFLTAFLRRRMVSIHISLFTVILPANPCKLYGRIPGTFWCYHIYHRHHHVPKRLGVFPVPWSSTWSWSLHLFLGRPMFLGPFGSYCSACFGSLFVSILCTWCSHFFWYCFISFIMFCAPVFWLIHWCFSLPSFVIPSKCLKISSMLLLNVVPLFSSVPKLHFQIHIYHI